MRWLSAWLSVRLSTRLSAWLSAHPPSLVLVQALELAQLESSLYKCPGFIFAQLSSTQKLTGSARLELNLSARRARLSHLSQYNIQENSPAVSQEEISWKTMLTVTLGKVTLANYHLLTVTP